MKKLKTFYFCSGGNSSRTIWSTIGLIFILCRSAYALEVIEQNKFYIYFSERQYGIAGNLLTACEPMVAFLNHHGLHVATPLHIILDDDLDEPKVQVELIPHREIRIPLRAPGVLEDGANEADPWRYFLFMGLCSQSIYSQRSGIPGKLHALFGEIVSPNLILPEWGVDGIAHLLYEKYRRQTVQSPMSKAIFETGPIPDLDKVSNHPDVWPGRLSHRIYGRPFIRWLDQRYGWENVLAIVRLHGKGIIPIEIDSEARSVFGESWDRLWQAFRNEHHPILHDGSGIPLVGYWDDPFIYWNDLGVYPGPKTNALRGRYGYLQNDGWLRLSQYDAKGISRVTLQRNGTTMTTPGKHFWDPGPGNVAISRRGRRPYLVLNPPLQPSFAGTGSSNDNVPARLIEAPPDVIQFSGPVADSLGRIAVAGQAGGNWDIWLYDGAWHQITEAPSIEMDPWLENGKLIFASNVTGRFQIHTYDMQQLTNAPTAAVLPRHSSYLQLKTGGWRPSALFIGDLPSLPSMPAPKPLAGQSSAAAPPNVRFYSPFKSLWPNYIVPDLFIDADNFQFGLATMGRDVTRKYTWDAGVRYSSSDALFSWRLGGAARNWNARATRYPFSYTTSRNMGVNEIRHDLRLGWSPSSLDALDISANWRYYVPRQTDDPAETEWWGSLSYRRAVGKWRARATVDLFAENSQSLYGEASYRFGQNITTVMQLSAGKTWGDLTIGHNTFRIGGNSAEGFFTQRATRLFPLRGFNANVLDAGQAATVNLETFWPLVKLQTGYKTLPLFLRNINLGTFVDSGFASDHLTGEDLLISAGFELITGMEVAWGFMTDFRLGVAWPLKQPDDLSQSGPVFLIQVGRPL